MFPNIFNDEDIDVVIDEIVTNKDFEKPNTERETYDSIEELNFSPTIGSWRYLFFR